MKRVGEAAEIIIALAFVLGFVMFLPPFHLAAIFARPTFCASCHNMRPELRSFRTGPHSKLASCNDCHLPNGDGVSHYGWEAVVGMRDAVEYFLLGRGGATAHASPSSKEWIQQNCVQCHAKAVPHMKKDRYCWDCHRQIDHRYQLAHAQDGTHAPHALGPPLAPQSR
jgi:cytochrome c nitrite reductase small subunit